MIQPRPTERHPLMRLLDRGLDWIEPIALAVMLFVFWFLPLERIFALLLAIPLLIIRVLLYRRPYAASLVGWLLLAFLILAVINIVAAPYGWGPVVIGRPLFELRIHYDVLVVGRPLLGMLLAITLADRAARRGQLGLPLLLGFGLFTAALALTGSIWSEKSTAFIGLLSRLPTLSLPDFRFNVNEIGGAMAWLIPVMLGIAWRLRRETTPSPAVRVMGGLAWVGFGLLLIALYLGQSRLAIIGVIAALFFQIRWTLPRGGRRAAYVALGAFALAEILVFTPIFNSQYVALLERDEGSLTGRVEIYRAAVDIVLDHPLTGVGMNAFRAASVREDYYVPGWDNRVLPHAHNEVLQISSDLGLPGAIWLALVYLTAGRMLLTAYQRGDRGIRTLAAAVAAGLIAHGIYGIGDAIPLWDRFSFVFWWLIGLAAALHAHALRTADDRAEQPSGAVVHLQADAMERARLV